ncbi:MAG: hypothetical protein AAF934_02340, partial [Bacteroidota bacterium]
FGRSHATGVGGLSPVALKHVVMLNKQSVPIAIGMRHLIKTTCFKSSNKGSIPNARLNAFLSNPTVRSPQLRSSYNFFGLVYPELVKGFPLTPISMLK